MLINLSKFLASDEVSLKIRDNFVIDDENFLKSINLNDTITFDGSLYKVEDTVLLAGSVKYTYLEKCARCLTEFDNTIETKFEAVVVKEENYNSESDEIELIVKEGMIDLTEAVKQLIYLSLPMKSVCKKDCKGICPTCGVNLNNEDCKCEKVLTDPRLEKLKDLLRD